METVFINSSSIHIQDFVVCVAAHTRLTNYDDALELVEAAFQMFDQFDGCNSPEAEVQLLFQHAQLMSLQNRWLDAKEALEACLSSNCMLLTASDVVWNAAAALATATAKCGDSIAGEKIIREAYKMAFTAHGTHGVPTLNMQHFLAQFLWEACDSTSAQKNEAEILIIRTVESKRLLLGAFHNSTIVSMQLMCQILSHTSQRSLCESALLDLMLSCLNSRGWLDIETIDALHLLARLYDRHLETERAELLYLVGLCLLDYISSQRAAILASKTQIFLLQLYQATAQSDKASLLRALILQETCQLDEQRVPLISRNFSVEALKESCHPRFVAQFFHNQICDLKRFVSSNHPVYLLVRLTEAILSRAIGQHDHARTLFSSCVAHMGNSWWFHPDCMLVVTSLASVMIASSDFDSSSALLTQASSRAQERNPHLSIQILLCAVDLFENAHKTEVAIEFLQRVVVLQSLHFGPTSSNTLSSQHLLADLYIASGSFNSAESVMWDALESCQASLGQMHESTIDWLEELCKLYALLHNIPKALFMANASLSARVNVFGENDVNTLAAIDRYARLLQISGQYAESKELFERCLQLRILSQGDDASSTKVTRAALAEVQLLLLPQIREQEIEKSSRRMCELEEDAVQALRADDLQGAVCILAARLEMAKDTFGSQSIPTARASASYGCVLLQMKQFQMSQVLLQQAVVAFQRELGLNSKEALVSMSALAHALVGIGDFQHAEEILIDCLDRCERSFGSHDNFYIKIVLQLGRLYATIDTKLQTARALLQECLSHASEERQKFIGEYSEKRHFEYLDISDDLAHVLVKLRDLNAAEACLQEAIQFNIQHYGSSHVSVLEATSRLANFFASINQPQQALPLLQDMLEVRLRKLGSASHATLCNAEDLSGVYESLSQFDYADVLSSLCFMQRRADHTSAPSHLISHLMRRALVLQQAGKFESALMCFLEYLDRKSSVADTSDSVAFKAALHAGFCMIKIGLLEHAHIMLNYCMQMLNNARIAFEGSVDRHKYFCHSNLGIVAASEGRFSDAEEHFVACLSLQSSTADTFYIERVDILWNLAIVYRRAGKFSQSESFFKECIQAHEQNKDSAHLIAAKHSLALLHWLVFSQHFHLQIS